MYLEQQEWIYFLTFFICLKIVSHPGGIIEKVNHGKCRSKSFRLEEPLTGFLSETEPDIAESVLKILCVRLSHLVLLK